MKIYTLNNREFVVWVPPDGVKQLKIIKWHWLPNGWLVGKKFNPEKKKWVTTKRKLPTGEWQMLGRAGDLAEDQCRKLLADMAGEHELRPVSYEFNRYLRSYTESWQSWCRINLCDGWERAVILIEKK